MQLVCITVPNNQEFSGVLMQLHQKLQELGNTLKKSQSKFGLDIFGTLENFSNLLDTFSKFPNDQTLDALIEKILHEVTFENIENLDIAQLKKLREILNTISEKMLIINQNLIKRRAASYIQEEFLEAVFDTFKREKAVIDTYIAQKILAFQQTLFDQSIKSVRNRLIEFQKDPTVITLENLARSLKFNMRFLDVIDRLDVLSEIFKAFNQLVKDIENTFLYPNTALQNLAKKTGRAAWLTKGKREIFDSLQQSHDELRSYVKIRLAKSRQEKN